MVGMVSKTRQGTGRGSDRPGWRDARVEWCLASPCILLRRVRRWGLLHSRLCAAMRFNPGRLRGLGSPLGLVVLDNVVVIEVNEVGGVQHEAAVSLVAALAAVQAGVAFVSGMRGGRRSNGVR